MPSSCRFPRVVCLFDSRKRVLTFLLVLSLGVFFDLWLVFVCCCQFTEKLVVDCFLFIFPVYSILNVLDYKCFTWKLFSLIFNYLNNLWIQFQWFWCLALVFLHRRWYFIMLGLLKVCTVVANLSAYKLCSR